MTIRLQSFYTFFLTLVLASCATSEIYREAKVIGSGTSNAHLSDGFTSKKIVRNVVYEGKAVGDEVYFITFGNMENNVDYRNEHLLAAFRATELALSKNFRCIVIFNEVTLQHKIIRGGSDAYFLSGTLSNSGVITGTLSQFGPIVYNFDRQNFKGVDIWGAGIYAAMSNSCDNLYQTPAIYNLPEIDPNDYYVQKEFRYLTNALNDELKRHLKKYLNKTSNFTNSP